MKLHDLLRPLVIAIALAGIVHAQQMNYQGRITDSLGDPVADGQYKLTLSLHDADGTTGNTGNLIWGPFIADGTSGTGKAPLAQVVNGRFNIAIGPLDTAGRPLANAWDGGERHLQLQVAEAVPILPRQRILHAPLALHSETANHATTATAVGNAQGTPVINVLNGRVGINRSSPAAALDVNGSGWFRGDSGGLPSSAGKGVRTFYDASGNVGKMFAYDYTAGQPLDLSIGSPVSQILLETNVTAKANLTVNGSSTVVGNSVVNGSSTVVGNSIVNGRIGVKQGNPAALLHLSNGNSFATPDSDAALIVESDDATVFQLLTRQDDSAYILFGRGTSSSEGYIQYNHAGDFVNNGMAFGTNGVRRMTISRAGNVGIGTIPTRAKLEVIGSSSSSLGSGHSRFWTDGVSTSQGAGNVSMSIYASEDIVGQVFRAFSDARIKTVRGRSDSAEDLETLLSFEITDYIYRDHLSKDNTPQKKVIAQQVEENFPQAVSRMTGVVPDIYERARLKDGWIQLSSDLKVGERVRLILEDSSAEYDVLEVEEDRFRTTLTGDDNKVFVYGREVDDFRMVDYEAISMLNVSATQELHRRLAASEAEAEALRKRVADLEARDHARDERLTKIESLLKPDAGALHAVTAGSN